MGLEEEKKSDTKLRISQQNQQLTTTIEKPFNMPPYTQFKCETVLFGP